MYQQGCGEVRQGRGDQVRFTNEQVSGKATEAIERPSLPERVEHTSELPTQG